MSRIGPAIDRPIPTNEKTLATQQASETESIQKTDITGKGPLDAEAVTKEQAPATDKRGQQLESRLGGLARQTELQAQLPVLRDLPDANRNLDPNVHLDEKIDVAKDLPGGHTINSGLAGMDWGTGKGKSGPNHMGVDITTGGMNAPKDVLAGVLQGRDGKSVEGGGVKGSNFAHGSAPPPGAELNFRAPNTGLVSGQSPLFGPNWVQTDGHPTAKDQMSAKEAEMKKTEPSDDVKKKTAEALKKSAPDGGTKMSDPDAAGGAVVGGSPEEIERALKAHSGQAEHGVNPDLGVNGGPAGPTPEERKDPMDLVRDPIGDGETDLGATATSGKTTLATDIHGPRTLNPDAGVGPQLAGGNNGRPGGQNPNTGNFS